MLFNLKTINKREINKLKQHQQIVKIKYSLNTI